MTDAWDPGTEIEENRHNWTGEPQHRRPRGDSLPADDAAPRAVDLFCGPGGLSAGLERAGFRTVLGVDIHEPSVETFQRNHPHAHALLGDVRAMTGRDGRDVRAVVDGERPAGTRLEQVATDALDGADCTLLTAGVPCQGFSLANRKRHDEDERNYLFEEFVRAAKILDPEFVLIENVSTMAAAKDGAFVESVVECLERLGYRVDHRVLNAADYGVPQRRERLFFLGAKDAPLVWPEPTHADAHRTVSAAIGDLPALAAGESADGYEGTPEGAYAQRMREGASGLSNHAAPNHRESTVERVRGTEPGEPMYDRFRQRVRLAPDDPAPTIIAGGIRPQFQYGHPEQARGLTVRERARLQSFPDSYVFEGGTVQGRVQTGMAVPPLLAERLGVAIRRTLAA